MTAPDNMLWERIFALEKVVADNIERTRLFEKRLQVILEGMEAARIMTDLQEAGEFAKQMPSNTPNPEHLELAKKIVRHNPPDPFYSKGTKLS